MPGQAIFVPMRIPSWGIHVVYYIIRFAFFLFSDVQVHGYDNFPERGFIFVVNHLSSLDVGLGLVILKGKLGSRSVVFAGDTWRKNIFTRTILQLPNAIWVHRGETSPQTIKVAIQVLREGYILGVAPEGTRSRATHALIKGKTGAAYLALMTNVPIIPIGITGMENLWDSMKRLRRIKITATIGKPFGIVPLGGEVQVDHVLLEEATTEIMCQIAALLPPEYRGEYADNPRLRELVEKTPTRRE